MKDAVVDRTGIFADIFPKDDTFRCRMFRYKWHAFDDLKYVEKKLYLLYIICLIDFGKLCTFELFFDFSPLLPVSILALDVDALSVLLIAMSSKSSLMFSLDDLRSTKGRTL